MYQHELCKSLTGAAPTGHDPPPFAATGEPPGFPAPPLRNLITGTRDSQVVSRTIVLDSYIL